MIIYAIVVVITGTTMVDWGKMQMQFDQQIANSTAQPQADVKINMEQVKQLVTTISIVVIVVVAISLIVHVRQQGHTSLQSVYPSKPGVSKFAQFSLQYDTQLKDRVILYRISTHYLQDAALFILVVHPFLSSNKGYMPKNTSFTFFLY